MTGPLIVSSPSKHYPILHRLNGWSLAILVWVSLFSSRVTAQTPTLSGSRGGMERLQFDTFYRLYPVAVGDTTVSPLTFYGEVGWPMVFTISARPNDTFRIGFAIHANEDPCREMLPTSFAADALWWEEGNEYADPNHPLEITTDSAGKATMRLGITAASISQWEKRGEHVIGVQARTLSALRRAWEMTHR